MTKKTVRLTDTGGHPLDKTVSIPRGAVVLINGLSGTAAQKFFSDGLWHTVNGRVLDDAELLREKNVYLIYVV